MKLTIGRNRKSHIWINKPEVSDRHAELWEENGEIIIQDLDSTNGTFKNDRRIHKSSIKESDVLKIADISISYDALIQKIEEIKKGNDYTEEFLQLKYLYGSYKQNIQKLKREQQKKPLVLRIMFSLIPVFVIILLWDAVETSLRYVIMVGGSSLIFGITSLISLGQEKQFNEKIEALSDEFQINYVCPKCRTRQGIVSWVVLASQKKCKICGAIWVKE